MDHPLTHGIAEYFRELVAHRRRVATTLLVVSSVLGIGLLVTEIGRAHV